MNRAKEIKLSRSNQALRAGADPLFVMPADGYLGSLEIGLELTFMQDTKSSVCYEL